MTVLVDEAVWLWRGERWAHLVSDRTLDELHEFADGLGLRRLGFQGDHYDVTAGQRERALVAGAEAVRSRDLVRRLRDAGLRRRAPWPRWARVLEVGPGPPDVVHRRLGERRAEGVGGGQDDVVGKGESADAGLVAAAAELIGSLLPGPDGARVAVAALRRPGAAAVVVEFDHPGASVTPPVPAAGGVDLVQVRVTPTGWVVDLHRTS